MFCIFSRLRPAVPRQQELGRLQIDHRSHHTLILYMYNSVITTTFIFIYIDLMICCKVMIYLKMNLFVNTHTLCFDCIFYLIISKCAIIRKPILAFLSTSFLFCLCNDKNRTFVQVTLISLMN